MQNSIETSKKRKNILKNITLWIMVGVVVFLAGCAAWLLFDKHVLKSKAPSLFGFSQFIIVSGSMSGTIDEGDMVITCKADSYKVGDIITFIPDNEEVPVTHRIVLIDGDKIYTKGDAMSSADLLPITQNNILGKVVSSVPKIGLFVEWFTQAGGVVYVILMVVVLVLLSFLMKTIKLKENKTEKQTNENCEDSN